VKVGLNQYALSEIYDTDRCLGMKRKASEDADSPDSKQRSKKARTESPEKVVKVGRTASSECASFRSNGLQDEPVDKQPLKIMPYPEKV
jgi:histone acetyltransferase